MRLLFETLHRTLSQRGIVFSRTDTSGHVVHRRLATMASAIGLLALAGCTGDSEDTREDFSYESKPSTPFVSDEFSSTRLILSQEDGRFKVVTSTPSFGGVTEVNIDEAVPGILEGNNDLFEYATLNIDREMLAQGYFLVPLTARATFTDEDDSARIHHIEVDDPRQVIRVAIPFNPNVVAVEFRKVIPDKGSRIELWEKKSVGEVRIDIGQVQQRQTGDPQ